ncbi:MAG: protein of unknown function containing DUF4258 domain [Marinobacter excellens HL-55]|uniref:DUF4258 domain-containing protein n=1 Tax=Marinobacter excellens HL-55 TaxID=1305731 RepID=A0A0P7ZHH8_9GAMM|nr:MAG: protein of unknown function containing DUF4258 domain [Marinobacter excellens HL-55]
MEPCVSVSYTGHALRRMFERGLSNEEVIYTLQAGETIAEYPEDNPYPSKLKLGWVYGKAIHVVASRNPGNGECYIITAYYPSSDIWADDFKTRR